MKPVAPVTNIMLKIIADVNLMSWVENILLLTGKPPPQQASDHDCDQSHDGPENRPTR